jgi:hypothetical protein
LPGGQETPTRNAPAPIGGANALMRARGEGGWGGVGWGGGVGGGGWGGGGGGWWGGGVRNVVPEVPVRVRVVRVSRDSHCRVDMINANNVHALERREAEADLNGLLAARACE